MKKLSLPILIATILLVSLVGGIVYIFFNPYFVEKKLLKQSKQNFSMFSDLTAVKIVEENYSISSDCYYGEAVRFYAIPKIDAGKICQQLENTLKNNNYHIDDNYCVDTRYKYDTVKELDARENPPKGVASNHKKDRKIIKVKVQNLEEENKNSSLFSYMNKNQAFWQDKTLVAIYSKIYIKPSYYNGSWMSKHKGKCHYKDYDMIKNTVTESVS